MQHWPIYFSCLISISLFAFIGWALSLLRNNVTHVDSMWSLFFVLTAITSAFFVSDLSERGLVILSLIFIWAFRLFTYLTWRNRGSDEDFRYVQIRKNNEPMFWLKSIYIIFGLQAMLAWIISISLFAGIDSTSPLNILDYLGIGLFIYGLLWEVIADLQLSIFKSNPMNKSLVLNTGLWRYSRHPNYFGECCIWWGVYLIALATGAWWAVISPIVMTILLLKVSGVTLLEQTITERRPAYREYIKVTNAFFPSLPKY